MPPASATGWRFTFTLAANAARLSAGSVGTSTQRPLVSNFHP
jgi:hypothetical protein